MEFSSYLLLQLTVKSEARALQRMRMRRGQVGKSHVFISLGHEELPGCPGLFVGSGII